MTLHLKESKVTLFSLSHNWLKLSKLCLNPLTKRASLIVGLGDLPMAPKPKLVHLLLSPEETNSYSFVGMKDGNKVSSHVIWFEQMLLRYHLTFKTINHSWNRKEILNFRYPYHCLLSIVSYRSIFTTGFFIRNTRIRWGKYLFYFVLTMISIKVWRRMSLFYLMTFFNEIKHRKWPSLLQ